MQSVIKTGNHEEVQLQRVRHLAATKVLDPLLVDRLHLLKWHGTFQGLEETRPHLADFAKRLGLDGLKQIDLVSGLKTYGRSR